MKMNDYLFFFIKKKLNKEGIFLSIIISLLLTITFLCILIVSTALISKNYIKENLYTKSIYIKIPETDKELEAISKMNHVKTVIERKYLDALYINLDNNNIKKVNGYIEIRPLIFEDEIIIKNGKMMEEESTIICPETFYPYSIYFINNDPNQKAYYKEMEIKGKKLLNSTITLSEEYENITLTIVGTYKNIPLVEMNVCYMSKDEFSKYANNLDYCDNDACYEYQSMIVIVDKYENMKEVKDNLIEMQLYMYDYFTIDNSTLDSMTYIPVFVALIVLIITYTILYNFIKKILLKKQKSIAIYKSIGYDNKKLIIINSIELIKLIVLGCLLSIILYNICFYKLLYPYFAELMFTNAIPKSSYLYMIVYVLLLTLLLICNVRSVTKKVLNMNIYYIYNQEK